MNSAHHLLRLPSIDGLLAFEAVARLGQLERAAEELHVSASAVSKRISALEELLGTPLIVRAPARPLALTVAGKEYLAQVRQALALLSAMPLHQRRNQARQRLRITTPPTFARQILVPALPAFNALHPELELELVLSVPFLDEGAPSADVEIRNGAEQGPGEGQVLMIDTVTPMAAPALIERLPPLNSPAALLQHAPLLRTPLEPWLAWLQAAGLADATEPDEGNRYVDLGLVLEAAVCGQGVALARPSLAAPYLRSGALRRLFPLAVRAAVQYTLVRHGDSAAAAQFASWLSGHCRTLQDEESSGAA
ncbi:LysR substrate-binding domain-containing protein [Paucibacter sp. R3-3]|uniref:LysR substrate-binding domain-containing protein n=1 Tax=Roseateles agri TaxID=3098619 RepID=A0ABU5DLI9_9BURK|nr:LysR substrate-binding domain-containing protein [Paucibacter sp. R3-3]MDY0747176.1 LysR substrate-binding domain-containing protein [Paucibacter sp. R3-3]